MMSGPDNQIAHPGPPGGRPRIVWPAKLEEDGLAGRERAFKAVHRIRRQIQVSEVDRQRSGKRRLLATAGATAAVVVTGMPVVGAFSSASAAAVSQSPLPVPTEHVGTMAYSLSAQGNELERFRAPSSVQPRASDSGRHAASEYVAPPQPTYSSPVPRGSTYGNYVVDLIYRYFPASQADFAARVAYCESGYNPSAVGDQGRARGIFQFWQATFLETNVGAANGWDAAFNAEVNVRAAAEKVARDGWRAWTCASKV
ncbi:MAG: transglycosylase SLT domain-containing protein [Dehalococcoidia bacterium]|nr:transglycosylase SLT domain-containing protein [Dehalococcoidia bacterium]